MVGKEVSFNRRHDMSPTLTIVHENDRFKIFEDGEPLQVTSKNGKVVVVEFENKRIAEDYIRVFQIVEGWERRTRSIRRSAR
jgi:hypothetical protein